MAARHGAVQIIRPFEATHHFFLHCHGNLLTWICPCSQMRRLHLVIHKCVLLLCIIFVPIHLTPTTHLPSSSFFFSFCLFQTRSRNWIWGFPLLSVGAVVAVTNRYLLLYISEGPFAEMRAKLLPQRVMAAALKK